MAPPIRFWASLTFEPGKTRVIGTDKTGAPLYRSEVQFVDIPGFGWMIWPVKVKEDGDVAFLCLIPESWEKLIGLGVTVGSEFWVTEGWMKVAKGVITRLA